MSQAFVWFHNRNKLAKSRVTELIDQGKGQPFAHTARPA
jgi:hypothetical protein